MLVLKKLEIDFISFQKFESAMAISHSQGFLIFIKNEFIHIGKNNDYQNLFLFEINDNYLLFQNGMSILLGNSQNNFILYYNLLKNEYFDKVNINFIVHKQKNRNSNIFFGNSKLIDEILFYDVLENEIICKCKGSRDFRIFVEKSVITTNGKENISCLENCSEIWNLNLKDYFTISPQWANGEPMFPQQISKVLYCETFNTIICFLKPYKIVGINAEKGEVVWEQKFIINTDNFVIDNETGMIYALEAVWDNEKDRRTILYQVINGGNGEIEFERDLYDELKGEKEPFNVHIHFAGFYEDAIYFSLYERGELYKASKFSANILEKYKHDKAFYGSPEIFNNRLFVAEDDAKIKRLLFFEI